MAREHRLPFAVYWIQPATVLAACYHYFHGHEKVLTEHATDPAYKVTLPGLRPLRIRDMPTTIVASKTTLDNPLSAIVLRALRLLFEQMDEQVKPVVLVNTFDALESVALAALQPYMDVFAVGPAVPVPPPAGAVQPQHDDKNGSVAAAGAQIHLFEHDTKPYMEWLDAQEERSVVYVSFGSLLSYTKRQAEEILHGLQSYGKPYLWVVRREGRAEEVDHLCLREGTTAGGGVGVVVEWCDQQRVLSHPAVGCFVTHCGWNSTLEAVVHGVPMVAAPSWSDQTMNAYLVDEEWEVGVRAERDAEGVLTREELVRCLELLMDGSDERAAQIRANAGNLRERAREAAAKDGPLERSLQNFVTKAMQDHVAGQPRN
ncbi:hypothetical protein U9M48_039077 [Paspalum notatum var. saurae]|uniref:UDP-glycosyltransferases domain-containing protein n=1 Tax=Paspalum notatum var. saurae TaxID=547442 RepID=A0AAQ3UJY4_PASNO